MRCIVLSLITSGYVLHIIQAGSYHGGQALRQGYKQNEEKRIEKNTRVYDDNSHLYDTRRTNQDESDNRHHRFENQGGYYDRTEDFDRHHDNFDANHPHDDHEHYDTMETPHSYGPYGSQGSINFDTQSTKMNSNLFIGAGDTEDENNQNVLKMSSPYEKSSQSIGQKSKETDERSYFNSSDRHRQTLTGQPNNLNGGEYRSSNSPYDRNKDRGNTDQFSSNVNNRNIERQSSNSDNNDSGRSILSHLNVNELLRQGSVKTGTQSRQNIGTSAHNNFALTGDNNDHGKEDHHKNMGNNVRDYGRDTGHHCLHNGNIVQYLPT